MGTLEPRSIDVKEGYDMPHPISHHPYAHAAASGAKLIL